MRRVQRPSVSQANGEDPVRPVAGRFTPGGVEHTIHIDQRQRPGQLHPSTICRNGTRTRSSIGWLLASAGELLGGASGLWPSASSAGMHSVWSQTGPKLRGEGPGRAPSMRTAGRDGEYTNVENAEGE